MSQGIKTRLTDDMKAAMRAKEKERLAAIRLILAAVKQYEVDNRADVTNDIVINILNKLAKQRRESISQFQAHGRDDLVAVEEQELALIQTYLPTPLSEEETLALVKQAIEQTQASTMADMGKVMGIIKSSANGRVDMAKVSALIKSQLA